MIENITFALFGMTLSTTDDCYGFWFFSVLINDFEDCQHDPASLFAVLYEKGSWVVDLCFLRIVG